MANAVFVHGHYSDHMEQIREDSPGLRFPHVLREEKVQGRDRVGGDQPFDGPSLDVPKYGLGIIGERLSTSQDVEHDVDVEKDPRHLCLASR